MRAIDEVLKRRGHQQGRGPSIRSRKGRDPPTAGQRHGRAPLGIASWTTMPSRSSEACGINEAQWALSRQFSRVCRSYKAEVQGDCEVRCHCDACIEALLPCSSEPTSYQPLILLGQQRPFGIQPQRNARAPATTGCRRIQGDVTSPVLSQV